MSGEAELSISNRGTKRRRAVAIIGLVLLLAIPAFGGDFYVQLLARMMIFAIFAMSFDLIQGVTGLVSQGQAAYFGLAGYALASLTANGEISVWWSLPLIIVAVSALSLVIGLLALRTSGIYFIMVTLAISQMIFYLFHDNAELGGSDGIYVAATPTIKLFGVNLIDLSDHLQLYYLLLAVMILVFLFLRRLLISPFGRALVGIRVNERRMIATGYNTYLYKLAAFVLSGALTGLAGYLFGIQSGYVNPELIGFQTSAQVLMMVVLGGSGNFLGAIIGAFLFNALLLFSKDLPDLGFIDLARHWQLWIGLFIILVIARAPQGVTGLLKLTPDTPHD